MIQLGNKRYRLVLRGTDLRQHQRAQQRLKVAAWLFIPVGLLMLAISVTVNRTFPWWIAAIVLANGLVSALLARVPPKSQSRNESPSNRSFS